MTGTRLFSDMPSRNTDLMRPVSVSYEEFKKIIDSADVRGLMKRFNIHCGMTKASGVTFITPFSDNNDEMRMQTFLNELDKTTRVYVRSCLQGNCGAFAYKKAYEKVYVTSKEAAMRDAQCAFDAFYCVTDFLYGYNPRARFVVRRFNPYEMLVKSSDRTTNVSYEEIKNDILATANEVAKELRAYVKLVVGRCGYDSVPYESFVVYRIGGEEPLNQIGRFTISQNKFGDCSVRESTPLGGTSCYGFDLENFKEATTRVVSRLAD